MSDSTLTKQTIAEALDYALQEHGLDDMGFNTSYAADIVIEALGEADIALAPTTAATT
jgi:hypothetical protein